MDNDTSEAPLKKCSQCGALKPATTDYFCRNKNVKSGLTAACKQCKVKKQQQYYAEHKQEKADYDKVYQDRNRDKIALRQQQYRRDNFEALREQKQKYIEANREKVRERRRKHGIRNRDKRRAYLVIYNAANREKLADKKRVYNQQKPEIRKGIWHRYRARKLALPDTFEARHWTLCLEYWHYTCAVCGSQLRDLFGNVEPHADHWIALTSTNCPGTTPDNMICLCNSCNCSKQSKYPDEWLALWYSKVKVQEILHRITTYFEWIKQQ